MPTKRSRSNKSASALESIRQKRPCSTRLDRREDSQHQVREEVLELIEGVDQLLPAALDEGCRDADCYARGRELNHHPETPFIDQPVVGRILCDVTEALNQDLPEFEIQVNALQLEKGWLVSLLVRKRRRTNRIPAPLL
jgi:hypothetical protein